MNALNISALCALACAATPTLAQTVRLYGILDASLSVVDNAGVRQHRLNSGDLQTSRLGIDVQEDLGDGLKANANLLSGVGVDTGAAGSAAGFWNLGSSVGLEGRLGKLDAGSLRNPTIFVAFNTDLSGYGLANYGNTNILHHQNVTGSGVGGFYANSVRYRAPALGGLRMEFAVSNGTEVDPYPRSNGYSALNAQYQDGALYVGAGYTQFKVRSASADYDYGASIIGATYDFKWVKVGGHVINSNRPNLHQNGTLINAKFRVVALGELDIGTATLTEPSDRASRTVSAGYTHHLSKRTDLYAYLLNLGNNSRGTRGLAYYGTPTVAAGASSRVAGMGIRHLF